MALPMRFPAPVINTDFFLISTMGLIYPRAPGQARAFNV